MIRLFLKKTFIFCFLFSAFLQGASKDLQGPSKGHSIEIGKRVGAAGVVASPFVKVTEESGRVIHKATLDQKGTLKAKNEEGKNGGQSHRAFMQLFYDAVLSFPAERPLVPSIYDPWLIHLRGLVKEIEDEGRVEDIEILLLNVKPGDNHIYSSCYDEKRQKAKVTVKNSTPFVGSSELMEVVALPDHPNSMVLKLHVKPGFREKLLASLVLLPELDAEGSSPGHYFQAQLRAITMWFYKKPEEPLVIKNVAAYSSFKSRKTGKVTETAASILFFEHFALELSQTFPELFGGRVLSAQAQFSEEMGTTVTLMLVGEGEAPQPQTEFSWAYKFRRGKNERWVPKKLTLSKAEYEAKKAERIESLAYVLLLFKHQIEPTKYKSFLNVYFAEGNMTPHMITLATLFKVPLGE